MVILIFPHTAITENTLHKADQKSVRCKQDYESF